jgi:hypothetical protein
VIAGERAHQPVRELPADGGLESLARSGPGLGQTWEAGTLVEQAGDGSAVDVRRFVHGPLVIGVPGLRWHPWRE